MAEDSGRADHATTSSALAQLPRHTWTVLQAIRWPQRTFANVGHVVVGPAGVFVVDTRTLEHGSGTALERAAAEVSEAAVELAATFHAVGPAHVHPVLCFEAGAEPVTGWSGDVLVCSVDNVAAMLTTRPAVLTPQHVIQLCLDLHGVRLPAEERTDEPALWAAPDPWLSPGR